MGKKAKVGKSRRDKYYQLAKDTGYRSRAAFKLLQLNRKYEFLQNSRVCIDLCAAPGGWLQVASQQMPVSSVIIGIDLAPIKPIHNVTTYQEDITSQKCRQILQKELSTWKADVVLHDGAPNVGMNWLYDAFQQASLTLKALKLATEFLRKGGWFVTKVFRSKDYHSLLWVFHQLFKKVFATKPQASRNESAEIFVVCQHYLAPDKIDPKLLDPKHVFSEVQEEPTATAQSLFQRDKEKRKAEGYADGNLTLQNKLSVMEYMNSENHWQLLANCTEIVLDDETIAAHPETTEEVRELCSDIKVLGKPALKSLDAWRKKVRQSLELQKKAEPDESAAEDSDSEEEDSVDEEEQDRKIIENIKGERKKELKKKRKKVMKEKRKLRDKMSLKMVIPGDQIETGEDTDMFSLKTLKTMKDLQTVETSEMPEVDEFAVDNTDANGKKLVTSYSRVNDDDDEDDDDGDGMSIDSLSSNDDDDDDNDINNSVDPGSRRDTSGSTSKNQLLVDLEPPTRDATSSWFKKDIFAGIGDDDDDDIEIVPVRKRHHDESNSDEDGNESDNGDDDSDKECENHPVNPESNDQAADAKPDAKSKVVKLTPLELAIGEELVKSKKRRRELIENSYHRYTNGEEEGLPDWFVEDERKHCRIERPVTKEQVEAYKAKKKAIDAAPIKKVAEANARKKRRMEKRLEKARKKAESVTDSVDISDKAKMKQVKEIYKKAGLLKSEKKNVTYVVGKKGVGKRVSRPPGVTGRFRVVDPRMKKDHHQRKTQLKTGKGPKGKGPKGKRKGKKSK